MKDKVTDITRESFEEPRLSDAEPEFPEREKVHAPKPEIFPTLWGKIGYRLRRLRRISTWEGKLFYGLISTASTYFLGVNVAPVIFGDPFTMSELITNIDFTSTETIIWTVLIIASSAASWFVAKIKQGQKYQKAIEELKDVFEWTKSARDAASEGGQKITKAELAEGLDEVADTLEEVLLLFNIDIDLNQDGK